MIKRSFADFSFLLISEFDGEANGFFHFFCDFVFAGCAIMTFGFGLEIHVLELPKNLILKIFCDTCDVLF